MRQTHECVPHRHRRTCLLQQTGSDATRYWDPKTTTKQSWSWVKRPSNLPPTMRNAGRVLRNGQNPANKRLAEGILPIRALCKVDPAKESWCTTIASVLLASPCGRFQVGSALRARSIARTVSRYGSHAMPRQRTLCKCRCAAQVWRCDPPNATTRTEVLPHLFAKFGTTNAESSSAHPVASASSRRVSCGGTPSQNWVHNEMDADLLYNLSACAAEVALCVEGRPTFSSDGIPLSGSIRADLYKAAQPV